MAYKRISEKTIERLIHYRRGLQHLDTNGVSTVTSQELSGMAHNNATQVRQDLLSLGYGQGSRKGYMVKDLKNEIHSAIHQEEVKKIVLVGVGNLGKAVLTYFASQKHSFFSVVAAFDTDPELVGKEVCGCKCYPMQDLESKISELGASLGVITVPADFAQEVADQLVEASIEGIVNFAPLPVHVPGNVSYGSVDITMELEKVAYLVNNSKIDD